MSELLPCPWCGASGVVQEYNGLFFVPGCVECDIWLDDFETAIEAIAAWNRRAQSAMPAEQWEPLPDGNYDGMEISGNGSEIWLSTQDVHGVAWDVYHGLDDDLRLCRCKPGG